MGCWLVNATIFLRCRKDKRLEGGQVDAAMARGNSALQIPAALDMAASQLLLFGRCTKLAMSYFGPAQNDRPSPTMGG